ncbi:hypothetical protein N7I30_15475 [Aurantimonas litoralis]|nr:hypothetical protein [Aurantimonas litoralis]
MYSRYRNAGRGRRQKQLCGKRVLRGFSFPTAGNGQVREFWTARLPAAEAERAAPGGYGLTMV